ncbi:hypothetical protein JET18_09215 [Chryseobacterium sp. L7]|uniref:Lipoprotein n=1 Tax=Chryseobacterium endalhagicum TaxID=2797638 RepID=A0ABS1QEJ0_9FLAO|nr:hypothetical protein [Chryseobacterium endalhagicum]MBL1221016.1 hypothetical protein [Chryseobacterium endalhagicum]
MIRKIFSPVLFAALILTVFYSCSNKKATGLNEVLAKKESQVKAMLIGEKGLESVKLNYLIAHDYAKALNTIDKEEAAFNTVIKDIEKTDTEGVKKGKEVQQAAIEYYALLKELFLFSRKEIEQEKLMRYGKEAQEIRAAQDQMLELGREKQKLYQKVFKADEKFFYAQKQFEAENNIK